MRLTIVAVTLATLGLANGIASADANETGSTGDSGLAQSSISAGMTSTCVIEGGAAKCWGDNTYGQLGNGTTESTTTPVSVIGLSSGVTSISVGSAHACAVVSGAVKCWGANESGQLGNGSTIASSTPVTVTGLSSGVTDVSAAGSGGATSIRKSHSCAVVSGAAKCWGDNTYGQLGNGSTTASSTPVSVSGLSSSVTAISTNSSWASYMGMMNMYSSHSCAVVSGAAKCWGDNTYGQLGNGSTTASSTPVSVSGLTSGVTAISAGGAAPNSYSNLDFSCAVVSGAAKCWGSNGYGYGQLGDGGTNNSNIPVSVSGLSSGVTAISVGGGHACALVSGGVKCWGVNSFGQLGNNSTTNSTTAVSVSGLSSGIIAVTTGAQNTCAVSTTQVKCWGSNASGQSGPIAFEVGQVSGVSSGATGIGASSNHACALVSGAAKCWGYNYQGQLGNGTTSSSSSPVAVSGLSSGVTAVDVGSQHSCALVSGAAKCWGGNGNTQLGNGNTIDSSSPVAVSGLSSGVTSLSTGDFHSCALVSDAAKCWGYNYQGQLGDGNSMTQSSVSVAVLGLSSGVTAISAGGYHTCAVVSGAAKCWGYNTDGQLGNGNTSNSSSPVAVSGLSSGVTAIGAGNSQTCAVVSGGLKCWGSNYNGQLGNGSTTSSTTPVNVTGLSSGVTAISIGSSHACAVVSGGLKCWGSNNYGQLGDGTLSNALIPVSVFGLTSGVTAVSVGQNFTCAVVSGAAKCWGYNFNGQLGIGQTDTGVSSVFMLKTPQVVVAFGSITATTTTTTTTTTVPSSSSTVVSNSPSGNSGAGSGGGTATNSGTKTTVPKGISNSGTNTTVVSTTTTTISSPNTPQAPSAKPGEAGALVDGKATSVSVIRSDNKIVATVAGITAVVSGISGDGKAIALDSRGCLRLRLGDKVLIQASGFLPGEKVSTWMFSTPIALGENTADTAGNVSMNFGLPSAIANGDHRLVLNGSNLASLPVVLGIGISVGPDAQSSSLSRILITVPVLLAIFVGILIPAVSRRRKRERVA